jgi:hypothetical protein
VVRSPWLVDDLVGVSVLLAMQELADLDRAARGLRDGETSRVTGLL